MRIPLDLYTLLGVPFKAPPEQIQQAFEDRLQQLPRSQYSNVAISSRKQLLKQIYGLLTKAEPPAQPAPSNALVPDVSADAIAPSDPDADADLLALFTEPTPCEDEPAAPSLPVTKVTLPQDCPSSPSDLSPAAEPAAPDLEGLDIEESQLCGALLLLHEIGYYDLIIELGQAFLERPIDLNQLPTDISVSEPDLIVSMALAYLEYGRECWQQRQSEQAALSLQAGLNLLIEEQIFPEIQQEIQSDLAKLRPYRILDLMQLPESEAPDRERGMTLLQEMLDERGGIEGSQNDASGLSVDDFLRFIQQIREHLRVDEQQTLFEQEADRPSAVAQYLAVYALVARGVAHGMPELIQRADERLKSLANRQDIYLEQAMCRLLLGQPAAATQSARKSQDQDSLTFIQQYSSDSPDWVPGLYLYTERWLQQEVYPYFRDLATEQVDLEAYFNDPQIQQVLNELSLTVADGASGLRSGGLALPTTTAPHGEAARATPGMAYESSVPDPWETSIPSALDPEDEVLQSPPSWSPPDLAASATSSPTSLTPSEFSPVAIGSTHRPLSKTQAARRQRQARARRRLMLAGLLLAGVGGGALALTRIWQQQAREPNEISELPLIQLEAPPIEIPGIVADGTIPPVTPAPETTAELTQDNALEVVRTWQTRKAEAMGQQYASNRLNEILVEPVLAEWQGSVEDLRQQQAYWQYTLDALEILAVTPIAADQADVRARVRETATFFQNGQAQADDSYNNDYVVQYRLVRQADQWRIREMEVVP
ncbi:DUF4101 domain-containing protein [Synechococcales cyanobacterium C]|uniref:DUF4101 domain-containing protein n=1 Tax=Petrachloros mirabilis ULC683 TaxID=2781853 RepID=A0A8K1ZX36_9CYAN|nr:DUF4101 domain-containing protein [Petrachloros mirabilis ULC683]